MILIDGSFGEGGGQILRSTLTLAMCLGKPVRINNIRSGRKKPGLLRQHLTCLRAAREVCSAAVTGSEIGSTEIEFTPGQIKSGNYHFAIGSAGSTSLVFQTVLPALLMAKGKSEIQLEGGTHNSMAPSFDFIDQSFVPALKLMGHHADVSIQQFGFYPAGGGAWVASIHPSPQTQKLDLLESGQLIELRAVATSSKIPHHVTQRELDQVRKKLVGDSVTFEQRLVESAGPGNIFSLQAQFENTCEVFEVAGERGLKAERVANKTLTLLQSFKQSGAAVGPHLADQLLVPMALGAGGSFTTEKPSEHLKTNCAVIEKITERKITLQQITDRTWQVTI